VNNINVTNIHNTYNTTVINNTTVNRVSYNGGNGGLTARPNSQQEAAAHEQHIAPVAVQTQHAQAARANPLQRVSVNQGKPAIAATPKPGAFNLGVPAKQAGAPYKPEGKSAVTRPPAKTPPAQPANNAPRPGTVERSTPAARNDVPRPPAAPEKASVPRPENTPRPGRERLSERKQASTAKRSTPGSHPSRRDCFASGECSTSRSSGQTRECAPCSNPASSGGCSRAEARPENAPKPEKEAAPEQRRQQQ
jgi:hypothetical protein